MVRSSMRRAKLAGVLVVTASLSLTACGGGSDDDAGGDGGTPSITIGYASPIASDPDQQALALGMTQAAEALGWDVRVVDANLSADKQVSDIDTLIGLDVGGIVSFSLDPGALSGAYARAAAADTPIVTFNPVDSEKDLITAGVSQERFLCPDSGSISQQMADYIDERAPGAKLLVVGPPPVPSLIAMTDCFVEAAEAKGLVIVDREDNTQATSASAQQITASMLTKNPDVDGIWTFNDTSAAGAGAAVQAAGGTVWTGDSQDGVVIIGGGADDTGIAGIEAGVFTVSYANNSFDAGVAAIRALNQAMNGDLDDKDIVVPSIAYDSSNVGEYVPDDQRTVSAGDVD